MKISDSKKRTIGFATKIVWQNIARMYNEEAEKYGLTISSAFLLLHIDPDGMQVTHLAPNLGMEASSITRLLNKIELKGWVERIREGKSDRRKVMIYLTEEGKKAQALVKHKVRHFNQKIIEVIPQENINVFYSVLDKVNEIVWANDVFEDVPEFIYNQFE